MAAQPAIDLTDFDLVPLVKAARRVTGNVAGRATHLAATTAKNTTYTAVGLGLLTYQRMQVRRRELERAMRD